MWPRCRLLAKMAERQFKVSISDWAPISDLTPWKSRSFFEQRKLVNSCPEVVLKYLDLEPNHTLSTTNSIRVGNKGSLSISLVDGVCGYWYCFETGTKGDMVNIIMNTLELNEKEALELGRSIIEGDETAGPERLTAAAEQPINQYTTDMSERIRSESTIIRGTLAEYYLKQHRGLENLPDECGLFFHPNVLTKTNEDIYIKVPALVALASHPSSSTSNIQVTYLDPQTGRKHSNLPVPRRTYGSFKAGDINHFCVLNPGKTDGSAVSYISEGIETGLSVYQVDPDSHILATLGKHNFTKVDPAILNRKVVLVWDNDGVPIEKDKILLTTVNHLKGSGKDVYLLYPPSSITGTKVDLNDILIERGREGLAEVMQKRVLKVQLDQG